eukprot:523038_1
MDSFHKRHHRGRTGHHHHHETGLTEFYGRDSSRGYGDDSSNGGVDVNATDTSILGMSKVTFIVLAVLAGLLLVAVIVAVSICCCKDTSGSQVSNASASNYSSHVIQIEAEVVEARPNLLNACCEETSTELETKVRELETNVSDLTKENATLKAKIVQ